MDDGNVLGVGACNRIDRGELTDSKSSNDGSNALDTSIAIGSVA